MDLDLFLLQWELEARKTGQINHLGAQVPTKVRMRIHEYFSEKERSWFGDLIGVPTGILKAIAAGISYAFYIIYTRKLSFTDSAVVTLLFTGIVGCIFISLIVPFYWINLDLRQLLLLILLASIGTLGHFLIILSLRLGEASKLAPLGYFEISTNILVGYAFFGDLPDIWIYLGLSLIVFSGIYIFIRERREIKKTN